MLGVWLRLYGPSWSHPPRMRVSTSFFCRRMRASRDGYELGLSTVDSSSSNLNGSSTVAVRVERCRPAICSLPHLETPNVIWPTFPGLVN